jgi:hypothetical protein
LLALPVGPKSALREADGHLERNPSSVEKFRQANRRIASIEACEASEFAETVERSVSIIAGIAR